MRLDQTSAWIFSFVSAGLVFGGGIGALISLKNADIGNDEIEISVESLEAENAIPTTDDNKDHPAGSVWSYEGKTGPEYWADLKMENALCREGREQSPVDLAYVVPNRKLTPLDFHYKTSDIQLIHNGYTLQTEYEAGSYVLVDKHRYDFNQFHFHTPSEHSINGHHYPLEIHLVHTDKKGRLAVVGILVQEGAPNKQLAELWGSLPREQGDVSAKVFFELTKLLPKEKRYFAYSGSLTTPPCTEGVAWRVLQKPIEMSKEQIADFTKIFKHNARPVQELFQRKAYQSAAH